MSVSLRFTSTQMVFTSIQKKKKKICQRINFSVLWLPDQQCEPEEGRLFNGFVLGGLGLMVTK